MQALGLVELQRSGDAVEHILGDASDVPSLEADVVLDADAGEGRDLLPAEALHPAVGAVGGQPCLLGGDAGLGETRGTRGCRSSGPRVHATATGRDEGDPASTCLTWDSHVPTDRGLLAASPNERNEDMRGAVLHGPGDIRVEERADPTIEQPTDAIIRLSATCVCGSDLWPYRGIDAGDGPAPMGHEYSASSRRSARDVTHDRARPVRRSARSSPPTTPARSAGPATRAPASTAEPMGAIGTQAEYARDPARRRHPRRHPRGAATTT